MVVAGPKFATEMEEKDGEKSERIWAARSCVAPGECVWPMSVANTVSVSHREGPLIISGGPTKARVILLLKSCHKKSSLFPSFLSLFFALFLSPLLSLFCLTSQ